MLPAAYNMSRPKNMVVAQSGGPSPVINNSLRGIVEVARDLAEIGTVYGARHGIEGVLTDGVECVTAPVGDGRALACELQRLADDPEELQRLASAGWQAYQREFSAACVGHRLLSICAAVSGRVPPRQRTEPVPVVSGASATAEPVG